MQNNNILLKSFQQIINRRTESIFFHSSVMKTNRHGKDDRRFLVATKSALYLFTQIKIIRSYKITRQLAWVDLLKLTCDEPNKIFFQFESETLNLTVEEPKNFLESIVQNLLELFGASLTNLVKLKLSPLAEIPKIAQIETTADTTDASETAEKGKVPKFQFAHLFLSYCHSLGLLENEIIYKLLKELQKKEFINIDLVQLKTDPKYIAAILLALRFASNNIQSLAINCNFILSVDDINMSGNNLANLKIFSLLTTLIKNNAQSFEALTIHNCTDFDGFNDFSDSILDSYLTTLCFNGTKFSEKILTHFIETLPQTMITTLQFIKCPFDKKLISFFESKSDYFSKVSSVAFNETDFLSDSDTFSSFFNFLSLANISTIELVDDHLDLSDVFGALDQSAIPVTSLNLSKNVCSSKFSGQYILPVTLVDVKLTQVHWSPTALFNLLTNQKYVNKISLDLSKQNEMNKGEFELSDGQALVEMHRALKPGGNHNISTLIWDYNGLSTGFFTYLSNMSNIEKLSINCCSSGSSNNESGSILNTFILYLQNTKLRELSFRGRPNSSSPYKDLVKGMFAVIGAHQSLSILDVSDNQIGDSGFELLVDCIVRNKNIKKVMFDGSRLQNPQKFIDCCKRLTELKNDENNLNHSLEYIEKPRRDLVELIKKEELLKIPPGSVLNAWNELEKKLGYEFSKNEGDYQQDNDYSNSSSMLNAPMAQLYGAMEAKQMTIQSASWDIEIKVPFNKEPSRWDELRERFSLQALTGIPPDEPDALIIL